MSLWRQLTHGLRVLTRRSSADRDVADEVQQYIDAATDAFIDKGMPAAEARRAARLEVGNATVVREQIRDAGWERTVTAVAGDLRYGARRLRSHAGFTIVAASTLALGIGATTAIFSAIKPVFIDPLPYRNSEQLLAVWYVTADGARAEQTFGTYRELAERSRTLEAIAVMRPWQPTITGGTEPERLEGQRVSFEYFRALGVTPTLGRAFEAGDDRVGGPRVVILSDRLWRRRFGGDPAIVGRNITLDDNLATVIGVMPASFENVLSPAAEAWTPLQYDATLPPQGREWGHHLRMIARLKPGTGVDQARHELDAIARTPVAAFARVPWAAMKQGLIVNHLQDDVAGAVRPALEAVIGAVLLVLVIACVNVTNLLTGRGAERRGELAMRAALGASRGRLVRQLLAESLLLAAVGGALGLGVAALGVRAFVAVSPAGLPRANAIALDGAVLTFALAVTTLVGLAVGLFPALQATRASVNADLKQNARGAAGGHRAARRALVVAEVALALVLLVSAGLLVRSLQRLFAVDPGFNPAGILTMRVQTSGQRFDKSTTDRFFAQSLDAVRRVPGVAAAAFTSQLPLSGDDDEYGARFEGDDPNVAFSVFRYAVSPGYFETIGIPLRRGRLLDAHDGASASPALVVSESLARRKFGRQDPLGRRLHVGPTNWPWFTIVGVVGDVRQASLAVDQPDAVYLTAEHSWFIDAALSLVVRAHGDPAPLVPAIKQAVWSADKNQPIARIATMDALLTQSAGERRFAMILFEAFAAVALTLAAIGIYGVLAATVTERTREIGVRAALGASRRDILVLVVRQGMALTAVGVVVGLAGATAASRALVTLLFGVSRLDPLTYAGVVALLAVVSALACIFPAWRASRVDPAITLRSE